MFVEGNGFVRVVVLMESGSLEDHAQRPSVVEVVVLFFCATVFDQLTVYSMKRNADLKCSVLVMLVLYPWLACVLCMVVWERNGV